MPDIRLPARQTFNQGNIDSCLSCAIATALEARGLNVPALSPAYHLYLAWQGSPASGGITVSRAQIVQTQYGICRQNLYPFDVGNGTPSIPPDSNALADGRRRRTLYGADGQWMFRRLLGLHPTREWQLALASGLPVLIRFWLNPGYWGMETDHVDPQWTDTTNPGLQNHAAVVLGYEAATQRFIVQDSHGTGFALNGQWYLPEQQAATGPIIDAYVLEIPLTNLT